MGCSDESDDGLHGEGPIIGPKVNLSEVDLRMATLMDADLTGADLTRAYLYDADMRQAKLIGANLTQANLRQAKLTGAHYNEETIFPDGFDPFLAGMMKLSVLAHLF